MSNKKDMPLSPHLSIYKLPLTPLTSIGHRISGFALYLGILLFSWIIILSIYGCNCIWPLLDNMFIKIILFLFTQALFYHLCNGIRHLVWDVGYGYELKTANNTAKFIIILAILLNIVFWYML